MDLELFAFWRTSATYRVRVALNLKGVAARETLVDMEGGGNRTEAFRRMNPMAAIPAMIDHDSPGPALTQSLAMLEFLDETAPQPPLLPADPAGRARVRSLALMLAADTHPLITPRVRGYLYERGFDPAAWKAWQTHWFGTGLRAVEQRLATEAQTGTYCHGEAITTADICVASIVVVMRIFDVAVPDIPTVERIMATCEQHPAFAKADPRRQAGAPAAA